MFIFGCTTPPNSLRSKKAFTHRRDISPMRMNCQYIYILLTNPLRPVAFCSRAHFASPKVFLKKFSFSVGIFTASPWRVAERG